MMRQHEISACCVNRALIVYLYHATNERGNSKHFTLLKVASFKYHLKKNIICAIAFSIIQPWVEFDLEYNLTFG